MSLTKYTVAATLLLGFFSYLALAELGKQIIALGDSLYNNGGLIATYAVGEGALDRDVRSLFLGSCNCTEVRLTEECSGVLEVLSGTRFGYGTATNGYFSANEAMVVWRQLGCPSESPEITFTN